MEKVLRLGLTTAVAAVTAFALTQTACKPTTPNKDGGPTGACTPGDVAEIEANCTCQVFSDCEAGNSATWACSNGNKCIETCTSASDCSAGQDCQNAICLPPACGNDAECSSGQQCVAGACVSTIAASTVAKCAVLPPNGAVNTGGSKTFWISAVDANGNQLPYEGAVTWGDSTATLAGVTVTGGTAPNTAQAAVTATVTGSTSETGTVTASIGSTTCTPANLTAFPAVAAGNLRVVAVDQFSGAPLSGATIVVDENDPQTAGSDGSVTITGISGTSHVVSVYNTGYDYVTIAGTVSTDIFVPVKAGAGTGQAGAPGKLVGNLANTDFNNLSIPTGTVHIDISGGSIAGNLIDLSLTTLLGTSVPTSINLGGTTAENVNLPDGIAIGLGPSMFKGKYSVEATPGVRALWSLGGNITLQLVLSAVSSASGGSIDIGSILTSVLPVLGELESGVTSGVTVTAGEVGTLVTSGSTSGTTAKLALDTLMRLNLVATVPNLPSYYQPGDTFGGTPSGQLSAAIVLAGVAADPQGFVPLGLTAGVNTATDVNQVAGFMGGPAGQVPLTIAPRNGGTETSPFMAVALAADLSSLTGSFGSGSAPPLVLSGIVTLPGQIAYQNQATTGANSITFTGVGSGSSAAFLGVPALPTLVLATRTAALPNGDLAAGTIALHRLDVTNASGEWEIYFPPASAAGSFVLPTPPGSFTDYIAGATSANLDSVALNLQSATGPSFDQVVSFQTLSGTPGPTVDDLNLYINQFSVEGINPQ